MVLSDGKLDSNMPQTERLNCQAGRPTDIAEARAEHEALAEEIGQHDKRY